MTKWKGNRLQRPYSSGIIRKKGDKWQWAVVDPAFGWDDSDFEFHPNGVEDSKEAAQGEAEYAISKQELDILENAHNDSPEVYDETIKALDLEPIDWEADNKIREESGFEIRPYSNDHPEMKYPHERPKSKTSGWSKLKKELPSSAAVQTRLSEGGHSEDYEKVLQSLKRYWEKRGK